MQQFKRKALKNSMTNFVKSVENIVIHIPTCVDIKDEDQTTSPRKKHPQT